MQGGWSKLKPVQAGWSFLHDEQGRDDDDGLAALPGDDSQLEKDIEKVTGLSPKEIQQQAREIRQQEAEAEAEEHYQESQKDWDEDNRAAHALAAQILPKRGQPYRGNDGLFGHYYAESFQINPDPKMSRQDRVNWAVSGVLKHRHKLGQHKFGRPAHVVEQEQKKWQQRYGPKLKKQEESLK